MKNTRLSDHDRHELIQSAETIFYGLYSIVEWPFDWEDKNSQIAYYKSLLPPNVLSLHEELSTCYKGAFKNTLATGYWTDVGIKADWGLEYDGKYMPCSMRFNIDDTCPVVDTGYGHNALEISQAHPKHKELVKFLLDWHEVTERIKFVRLLVQHVVNNCNTTGQIRRVWPDLIPILSGNRKVQASSAQKRTSQLPEALDVDRVISERVKATEELSFAALLTNNYVTMPSIDVKNYRS